MEYRRVLIVGTGGVGFYLSLALNRNLPHGVELVCYDADTFEGGLGHSRLPRVINPATKKVDFLRRFAVTAFGDRPMTVVPGFFAGSDVSETDLVVDCSDMNLDQRRPIWNTVQASGARILRVSYDGLNETVVVAEGLPLMSGNNGAGGYRARPLLDLSMAAGGLGSIVVRKILAGELDQHVEFQISVNELLGASTYDLIKAS